MDDDNEIVILDQNGDNDGESGVQQQQQDDLSEKLFEINDIVGNLFWVVKRFEYENGQLKRLVQVLLHFKHMLLFGRGTLFTGTEWNQRLCSQDPSVSKCDENFNCDLENCLEEYRKLLEQLEQEKVCEFVRNKENLVYGDNQRYCRYEDDTGCFRESGNESSENLRFWFGDLQREMIKFPNDISLANCHQQSMTSNNDRPLRLAPSTSRSHPLTEVQATTLTPASATLSKRVNSTGPSSSSSSLSSSTIYKLVKISGDGEPSKYVKVPYESDNRNRNIIPRTKLIKLVVPKSAASQSSTSTITTTPKSAAKPSKILLISNKSSTISRSQISPPPIQHGRASKRKSTDSSYRGKTKKSKTPTLKVPTSPLRKSQRTATKLSSVCFDSDNSDNSDDSFRKPRKSSKKKKTIDLWPKSTSAADDYDQMSGNYQCPNTETIVLGHSYFPKPNVNLFVETTENRYHDRSLNVDGHDCADPSGNGDQPSVSMTVMRHPNEHLCLIPGCDFASMYRSQTVGHIYRHFKLAPFRCSSCQQLYHTKSTLYKHVSRIHKYTQFLFYHMDLFTEEVSKRSTTGKSCGLVRYVCKMERCEFVSESLDSLSNHLKWHLDQSPFRCPYCERRFSDRHNGYLHVKHSHRKINSDYNRDAILRCPFVTECRFQTERPNSAEMLAHIESCHQLYRTVPPGWSVDRNGELVVRGEKRRRKLEARLRRQRNAVQDGPEGKEGVGRTVSYRCTYDKCRFKCKSITEMRAHELRKHRSQPYQCTHYQCQEVFTRLADRRQHIRDVHEIAAYKCEILGCNEAFNMREKLVKHRIEGHTTEGNNQCSFCQKTCASRFNLVRHLQLNHTREGSFPCGIEQCDFVGKIRNDLLSHRNSAHGKKAIKCPFEGCGRILNNQSTYHYHVKRHKNIRNKQCSWPDCGKWFDSNKALNDHHRIHLNYKRYRCKWPGCDYASEQRTNVIKHIRIRHLKLPMTKKQELEMNLPVDPNAPRAVDFVEDLPDFQV